MMMMMMTMMTTWCSQVFDPFRTIHDDDALSDDMEIQTDPRDAVCHDDDALNVPFSSEDRDTEDDTAVTSPSRFTISTTNIIIIIIIIIKYALISVTLDV